MGISWTSITRKSISRRIVKIPIENDAYTTSKDELDDSVIVFQEVDEGNREWFDYYNGDMCLHYENEKRLMNGILLGQTVEQNLLDSASQTDYNLFFEKGENYNPYLYPRIIYMVHGLYSNMFRSNGTAGGVFTVWEKNGLVIGQNVVISDNGVVGDTSANLYIQNIVGASAPYTLTIFNRATGAAFNLAAYLTANGAYIKSVTEEVYENQRISLIDEYITIVVNGWAPGSGVADTLAAGYTVGSGTISMTNNILQNGDFVIGDDGTDGVVFELTSGPSGLGPYAYTVREVYIHGNIAVATLLSNVFSGWSNAERQTLVAASYNNTLNQLVDAIDDYVWDAASNTWEDILAAEKVKLLANEEDRIAKQTQNIAAIADVDNSLLQIATWKAYPKTGATGRFSDGEVSVLRNELVARPIYITTRLAQIVIALGNVVDNNGSYTFGTAVDDIYYRRYRIIDYRINRAYGSISKYIRQGDASDILVQLIDVNTGWDTEYDKFMLATKFVANGDNTNTIAVESSAGFLIGDLVYFISEAVAETSAYIIAISHANNTISLSVNVSEDLTILDLARVYKTL